MSDDLTLTVDGQVYAGWTSIKVERSIDAGASIFSVEVSERWAQQPTPWQIQLFLQATASIEGEPILTGFVERYEPSYDAKRHSVRISGRSKTCDIVDCMPQIPGTFLDQTLDSIANAMAAPFGINVIVQCPMGDAFPTAILEKTETAHAALERLARMRSVLVTDDENGNLVLTQAGLGGSSSGALVEGSNILAATAKLGCDERYASYFVLGQAPLSLDDIAPQSDVKGMATDSSCPRPRAFAEHAEEAVNDKTAMGRANWRKLHNMGKGIEARITVQGWRQTAGGELWKPNQMVFVKSPMLELDRSLLIGGVSFLLDDAGGRRTELTLAPPEAYTPESVNVNDENSNAAWTGK